jgi:hypothetical protein
MGKFYKCNRVVEAEPMTLGEYDILQGYTIPRGEAERDREGYLISYQDGRQSWMLKDEFEENHEPLE